MHEKSIAHQNIFTRKGMLRRYYSPWRDHGWQLFARASHWFYSSFVSHGDLFCKAQKCLGGMCQDVVEIEDNPQSWLKIVYN